MQRVNVAGKVATQPGPEPGPGQRWGNGAGDGVTVSPLQTELPRTGSLVLTESAFDGFPGPVLAFAADASLLSARPADGPLALAVQDGAAGDVIALVRSVIADGAARLGSVQIEGDDGVRAFDLSVLPLMDGGILVVGREVTLHHNLRAALVESRQRYKDFVEISSDFAWETGPDGSFVFVSPRGALGFAATELVGRDPTDLVMEREPDMDMPFVCTTPTEDREMWLRRSDGGLACLQVSAKPVFDRDGRWIGARGVCRDTTVEREREGELKRARNREQILNHIVRAFRDEVDPKNMLRVAAETLAHGMGAVACQVFRRPLDAGEEPARQDPGLPPNLIAGARFGDMRYIHAAPVLERIALGEDLVECQIGGFDVLAAPAHYRHELNGAVVLWRSDERGPWGREDRLLIRDIADQIGIANEQIATHENIVRLSRTDGLTGLFNRRAFFEELERRFARLERARASAALMYVDLDNFKAVNDLRGHGAGDAVLLAVRDMLVSHTRPTDLVARLGGDEFAVWLEGGDQRVAEAKAALLLEISDAELRPQSGDPQRPLGLSIGIAVHDPVGTETLDDMIGRADQAMYAVKRRGKRGVAVAPAAGGAAV